MSELFERIKTLCRRKKMKIDQFYDEVRISKQSFKYWRRLDIFPPPVYLECIAGYFGVPVTYLTGQTKESTMQ